MLTNLQILEQTISDLKIRYNITATELANLKLKLAQDDRDQQITNLEHELAQARHRGDDLATRFDELNIIKTNLTEQVAQLTAQNERLTAENKELHDKNALAISRAEVIQTWLSKIDHQHS